MSGFFSEENGFSWKNYGKKWVNEHRIPKIAYDHTDEEDVKRCWSPHNMHPMDPIENKEKADNLIGDEIEKVPPEFWPKAWGGVFPDVGKMVELYAEWEEKKRKAYDLANDASSSPSASTDPVKEEGEEYEDSEPEEDEDDDEAESSSSDGEGEGDGFDSSSEEGEEGEEEEEC